MATWGKFVLMLYTPEQLAAIPDGNIVIDIFGKPEIKGEGIDMETRGGYTAFGYLKEIFDVE